MFAFVPYLIAIIIIIFIIKVFLGKKFWGAIAFSLGLMLSTSILIVAIPLMFIGVLMFIFTPR
jgi:hypothetical protein